MIEGQLLQIVGKRRNRQPVLIDCEGVTHSLDDASCGKWVEHKFVNAIRFKPGDSGEIYACTGCGTERRFG